MAKPAQVAEVEGPAGPFELRGPPNALVGVLSVAGPAAESPALADPYDLGLFKSPRSGVTAPSAGADGRSRGAPRFDFNRFEAVMARVPAGRRASAPLIASTLPPSRKPMRPLRIGSTAPGETRLAAVRYAVDPRTPPGDYRATFSVGSLPREARIHVLPLEGLAIQPARLDLTGRSGSAVTEPLVLENTGNVPLALGALGAMVTEEEEQICLSLQQAMAHTGNRGFGGFLDSFAASLAERKTDTIRVAVASGVTLAPGEARSVPVTFYLPKNLKAGRRYDALLRCRSARLSVQITVTGARVGPPKNGRAKP